MLSFFFFSRENNELKSELNSRDQQEKKSTQINDKLKRALQTIKEKIHRIVQQKPEWFSRSNADTIERIDQLLTAMKNQTKQIEELQGNLLEKDQERIVLQQRLDELTKSSESLKQDHNGSLEQPISSESES